MRHPHPLFQKVQHCSAGLIFKASKRTHVTSLLAKLHWLPISQIIDYKISSMCYNVVSDTGPPYLSDLLRLYVLSVLCVPLLIPALFEFQKERHCFKGSVPSPISALSLGMNSLTQYAMLKT